MCKWERGSLVLVALVLVAGWNTAQGTPLLGTTFGGPTGADLYDINSTTGQATGARATGVSYLVGIEWGNTAVYGLSSSSAFDAPGSLFTIDPSSGAFTFVGATGLGGITEGDLAFDPVDGVLYGLYNLASGRRELFTINTVTGAATTLPVSLAGDPSAMAFDAGGNLFMIDTSQQTVIQVDKLTGTTLSITPLSGSLGSVAGMDTDPTTGVLYVADGQAGGTNLLYTLDPATGILTEVGPTGLPDGLAGLTFVPEPATALLAMFGLLAAMRRRYG